MSIEVNQNIASVEVKLEEVGISVEIDRNPVARYAFFCK